jgi:lipopolysaccharide export system permease protein
MLRLEAGVPDRKNAELTPPELLDKIGKVDSHQALSVYRELNRRLSLPFLCIVLIFFGPSLSLLAGRSGKLGGLTLGLAVFTIYYMLLIYGENLVRAGKIPHYVGAWVPTLVLVVFAAYMFRRESSR